MAKKKLLLILPFCLILNACYEKLEAIEVIVVNKTPRGAYAEGNDPNEINRDGWYLIGLSRNGEEPVEYLWRAEYDSDGYVIINAKIGDKGTIKLYTWAKEINIKLPRPNAKKPPIIGALGEVYWRKID
jgi:hypothetical protein